jgi:hypothetical protein
LVQVQNTICVNYDLTHAGNTFVYDQDTGGAPSAGILTEATNLNCNPYLGGTSFGTPAYSDVFNNPSQTSLDYTLKPSTSPALNAASDPGSSPEGQNLAPAYQMSFQGLPTPGTPIPAKTARSDVGPALTGSIGAFH